MNVLFFILFLMQKKFVDEGKNESHNKTFSINEKGFPNRCIKYLPDVLLFLGWFGSLAGV